MNGFDRKELDIATGTVTSFEKHNFTFDTKLGSSLAYLEDVIHPAIVRKIEWCILIHFYEKKIQEEGNRYYKYSNIVLKFDQIRKLKNMNKLAVFDSSFVRYLLSVVFGEELNHATLDATKMKLVEGMFEGMKWMK